jgi:hypothetical protein
VSHQCLTIISHDLGSNSPPVPWSKGLWHYQRIPQSDILSVRQVLSTLRSWIANHPPDAAPPDHDHSAIALTVALALALALWLSGSLALALESALRWSCRVVRYARCASAVALRVCAVCRTGLIVARTEHCSG